MFCQSQVFLTEKIQILSGFSDFQKKPSALKKSRISKSGFKKAKLAPCFTFNTPSNE